MDSFDSLANRPYRSSFLADALDCIRCLHKVDEYKFLLVDQH